MTGHRNDIDLQTVKAEEAAVSVAQAGVSAQNLLGEVHQNQAYASVVAPFDLGVSPQRNVEVGALVQSSAAPAPSC